MIYFIVFYAAYMTNGLYNSWGKNLYFKISTERENVDFVVFTVPPSLFMHFYNFSKYLNTSRGLRLGLLIFWWFLEWLDKSIYYYNSHGTKSHLLSGYRSRLPHRCKHERTLLPLLCSLFGLNTLWHEYEPSYSYKLCQIVTLLFD